MVLTLDIAMHFSKMVLSKVNEYYCALSTPGNCVKCIIVHKLIVYLNVGLGLFFSACFFDFARLFVIRDIVRYKEPILQYTTIPSSIPNCVQGQDNQWGIEFKETIFCQYHVRKSMRLNIPMPGSF